MIHRIPRIPRIPGTTIGGLFIVSLFLVGACQLPPTSETHILTLQTEDFKISEDRVLTQAIADYPIDITAADVNDSMISALLQFRGSESWEAVPFTVHGFIPGTEPREEASLSMTYVLREGNVRLAVTAELDAELMGRAVTLFDEARIRIRFLPTREQG